MTYKWKPLERAVIDATERDRATIELQAQQDGSTFEEAKAKIEKYEAESAYWINDLYQVQVRVFECEEWGGALMKHLNIRRRDGAAIFDWRHRQKIKNQLLGPECEAVELYPAESRKQDTSNKYHLWGFVDPRVRFPFGMQNRDVVEHEVRAPAGHRQRRMQDHDLEAREENAR
jgi:hypothetical protein